MTTALIKVELRKTWPYYAPIPLILVGYTLLSGSVLKSSDLWLAIIAGVQGWLLAWALFRDPGHTAEFLFSRPVSRRRLFLVRWGVGLGLQVLTLVGVAFVLASGLRSAVQVHMNSPFYPMVRWLELSVLWPLTLFSVAAYQLQVFFQIRAQVVPDAPVRWTGRILQMLAALMVLWVLYLAMNQSGLLVPSSLDNASGYWTQLGFYSVDLYVIGALLLGTLAARQYYEVMEVAA